MQFHHSRSVTNVLKVLSVCISALALILVFHRAAKDVATILFGGCLLSFLISPLCRILENKLRRPAAALFSICAACLILAAAIILTAPLLLRQFSTLMQLLPEAFARLKSFCDRAVEMLQDILPELEFPELSFTGSESRLFGIARSAAGAIGAAADGIYRVFLMGTLGYFLAADREHILLRLELLIPNRLRRQAVRAGSMFLREMRLYLRGQATIALAVGILAASALTLIGIPGAPLLGLFVGMFNIIPYVGPFLGGIPAVVTALSISWQKAAFSLLSLFLVQQIDGMVISPRVMGNITGFSPAVVLLAIFTGARIGGIGGMLLSLPVLMAIRTIYRVFVQRHENN